MAKSATKADLSRELVVDRALEIADAEGLDAVTVRRLASEFGVTPMALYWHVQNKDELLAAMGDRLFVGLPAQVAAKGAWHVRLRSVLEVLVGTLRAHPGALRLAGPRILMCDDGRELTELCLAVLAEAGFPTTRAAEIARSALQTAQMLVETQAESYFAENDPGYAAMVEAKHAELARLSAEKYPRLAAAAPALMDCDDEDAYYGGGIDLFIAGVKALQPRK